MQPSVSHVRWQPSPEETQRPSVTCYCHSSSEHAGATFAFIGGCTQRLQNPKNLNAKVLASVCSSRAFLHHSCSDHVSLRISFRNCGREIRTWEDSRLRSPKLKKHASQHPKTIYNLMKLLKWRLLDLFLSIPATGAVTLVPTIPATKPAPKWSIGPSSRPVFVLAKCLVCLGLFELMENLHQANYQFRSLPMKRIEKEAYQAYHPLSDSDGMPRYS